MPTPPDVDALAANRHVKDAFRQAWRRTLEQHAKLKVFQEFGGWIWADAQNPASIRIQPAPDQRSKPFKASSKHPGAINLEDPEHVGNLPPEGFVVVGNYHTHPDPDGDQQPSRADFRNAWGRGVPGFVISLAGVLAYGPEQRASFTGPRGYPETNEAVRYTARQVAVTPEG